RFCQAGMWYRPVRERSPQEIMRMAGTQLSGSGHQELALASLSTTDYTCLAELLTETVRSYPEVRVSLPSLRVDTAAVRLAQLASPTGPSVTLAPEAGSRRMWDVTNKNVTEAEVLAAAEEAFRSGRTTLKLYFMIGLPLETDEDVIAIAELCLRVRDVGRRVLGTRAGRLQLNVSVNNFIPKPFTPFQWCGMADRDTLARRQDLLRFHLRRRGVKLTLHEVEKSYLEAALARGGEEMGAVIEEAWRRGARFDSWTEQFRGDAWAEALALAGTSAECLATTAIPRDRPLPWDVITGVVDRGFLWEEWQRAVHGVPTADCRWDGCTACGACLAPPANDLAASSFGRLEVPDAARPVASSLSGPQDRTRRQRYVLTFSITGKGRFVGHLDRVEMFRRAVRRAGGRLALSEGMRPKPLLSLALPLAVGWEGLRELCAFELAEEPPASFFHRLDAATPNHIRLISLDPYTVPRSLPARVAGAVFEVEVRVLSRNGGTGVEPGLLLSGAAARFEEAPALPLEERREGRVRTIDVKRYVDSLSVEAGRQGSYVLTFRAAVTPSGTARPERIVEAMSALSGLGFETTRITRMQIELA
ncbi:MAG: TIGR03936 family radical SAM-associated protein, partial [Anaerolineae bacterium]